MQHAAQGRQALAFQVARGDAIRRNHEVLDQLFRTILRVRPQVRDDAVVEHRANLRRFQLQRALRVTQSSQRLCGLILDA